MNGIAEIAGVPDVLLAEFSTRTTAVNDRLETKLDRFIATSIGNRPGRNGGSSNEKPPRNPARRSTAVDAASLHAAARTGRHLGIDIGEVIRDVTDRLGPPHRIDSRFSAKPGRECRIRCPSGDRVADYRPVVVAARRTHPGTRRRRPDHYRRDAGDIRAGSRTSPPQVETMYRHLRADPAEHSAARAMGGR